MSIVQNNLRFLKIITISLFAVILIVGCSNRGFNNNNPNLIDGSADFDIDPSISAGSSGSSSREEMGDQFNETAFDDINIIVPESYSQGDPVAEKADASEGSSKQDESVIGHDYLSESFIGTPVPSIISVPELCIYTSLRNVNCRASDYVESSLIAILMQGEEAKLLYLNPTFTHGKFELAAEQQCWMSLWLMDGPEEPYKTCQISVVDAPPPLESSDPDDSDAPVCSSGMDQVSCEAAGGTWVGGATGAPCDCP